MKNCILFATSSYAYAYSYQHKEYIPFHRILARIYYLREQGLPIQDDEVLATCPQEEVAYYLRKYEFLKQTGFIAEKEETEFGEVSESMVQKEVMNLSTLTFEVTEKCNLRCRYCIYGDFYKGYDERKGENMSFAKARQVLDFLFGIWEKASSGSHHTLAVGFYGGEPLMNIGLIKQIIAYIEQHKPANMDFVYNMTTNAMLLKLHQDFLARHNFRLLISLDGTEADDCHRITTGGKSSFHQVFPQIKELQTTYPEYFRKYVSFNSVIHSQSNIERIIDFFKTEFDKTTSLSELNNSGVTENNKYVAMKQSVAQSIALSSKRATINKNLMYNAPDVASVTYFLHHLSNEVFRDYRSMFYREKKGKLLPTGTCIPFNRKMYVTVQGKILVCERISHEYAVGQVTDDHLTLDFSHVAEMHQKYCSKLLSQCKQCYMQESCMQCMYYTNIQAEKAVCHNYKDKEKFAQYLGMNVAFLEHNRWAYLKVMEEIFVF